MCKHPFTKGKRKQPFFLKKRRAGEIFAGPLCGHEPTLLCFVGPKVKFITLFCFPAAASFPETVFLEVSLWVLFGFYKELHELHKIVDLLVDFGDSLVNGMF